MAIPSRNTDYKCCNGMQIGKRLTVKAEEPALSRRPWLRCIKIRFATHPEYEVHQVG
jgi:hypothetical protein